MKNNNTITKQWVVAILTTVVVVVAAVVVVVVVAAAVVVVVVVVVVGVVVVIKIVASGPSDSSLVPELKASRWGQDKRDRRRSAAIPRNELPWENVGRIWQNNQM